MQEKGKIWVKVLSDMSDWLITVRKKTRQQSLLSSKRKLKSNLIKYISSNSTLQCDLIEGPLFIKSRVCCGIYGGHRKNTCPLEGGLEIKILKANGRAKEKKDVRKRAINLSEQLP